MANEKLSQLNSVPLPIEDDALLYIVQNLGTAPTGYSVTFADLSSQIGGLSAITDLTGDVTASGPGSVPATLANTAVTPGTYGSATQVSQITVDAKGRLTAAGNVSITATGTVTSVACNFAGGLISVGGSPITSTGTLAFTVAGTSGGIPYFSGASTWASSAALTANGVVIGGGAGNAPSSTAVGTAGQVLTSNGAGLAPTFQAAGAASMAIGGTVTSGTAGSVLFVAAGPVLAQNNTNFNWDDTNKILAISGGGLSQFTFTDTTNSVAGTARTTSTTIRIGATTNHNLQFLVNNSVVATLDTSSNFNLGAAISSSAIISAQRSSATASGVIGLIRNASTATHSFSQVELDGNNGGVISTLTVDGLGSGAVLGAAGAYVGTFTSHVFGFTTAGTLRMSISNAGVVNIANLTASRPVLTDGSKNLVSGSAGFSGTVSPVTSITVVAGIVTAVS